MKLIEILEINVKLIEEFVFFASHIESFGFRGIFLLSKTTIYHPIQKVSPACLVS